MPMKFYSYDQPSAPTLNNSAGTLTTLLKTLLVDGFGLVTLDSLVVSGGIATATRAAGVSAVVGSMQSIAGASPGALNGDKVVLTATGNSFTYDATGVANQTATGTITAKVTPLGWTREFNATNIEVFRPSDTGTPRHYLRVDDTGTTFARVLAYETMSDVDTGTNPYPSSAQISGGGYWTKTNSGAGATNQRWWLVGDGGAFQLFTRLGFENFGSQAVQAVAAFGAFPSLVPSDPYRSFINCSESSYVATAPTSWQQSQDYVSVAGPFESPLGTYLARGYTGVGISTRGIRRIQAPSFTGQIDRFSGSGDGSQYPNGSDGAIILQAIPIYEWTNKTLRGYLPGLYATPQSVGPLVFTAGELVTSVAGLSGRTFRAFPNAAGVFFVDCTGPW